MAALPDEALRRPTRMLAEVLPRAEGAGAVRPVYQPIIDLATDQVVGFEALTRGPAGTELEPPLPLFAAMRDAARLTEFDRACRDMALAAASRGGIEPPLTVFVNVEPELLDPDDETWERAPGALRCCIEVTERALTARPAELLHAVARVREQSWGVALDDVGADPQTLALMALLRPDVIKLDLRLVQQRPDREVAEVVAAVNAQAEETGALVLAEGIETEEHHSTAMAMGAALGQGYRFGRPAALPQAVVAPGPVVPFLGSDLHPDGPTPFELVRTQQAMRRGGRDLVHSLVVHVEELALGLGPATVALASTSEERLRLDGPANMVALAAQAALVGIVGVAPRPGLAFRAGPVAGDERIAAEWSVAVLSPHFAAAVVARQVGQDPPETATYEFAVTHRRDLVASCARALAARLAPLS
jgi:EAL domain-containing protein (putative c-di-GMP-specific phosphodiesterase class I)